MITVKTYSTEQIPAEKLAFSVIAARYRGKWVFCRHKKRTTWEIPGGHREAGETADVNGDGVIDARDATGILRYLSGKAC